MTTSKTKVLVTVLLLCVVITPIIQIGVVSGDRGRVPGGGGGGNIPPPRPNPPPKPTLRPNPPASINLPTARLTGGLPTVRPTVQPTFSLPTSRPTFSVSSTRSLFTSFSFHSSWTGITFTRTFQTSYTFSPTFTFMTTTTNWYGSGGYWYPGMGFLHYGYGYVPSTGSFTLGQTLYDANNNPCLYYDYFVFDAPAGLTISAQMWTTGQPINYIILPVSVLSQFKAPGSCSELGQRNVNLLNQIQTFGSTPYTLTWTSPTDDQYAIVFFSKTPYGNTIYFLPSNG